MTENNNFPDDTLPGAAAGCSQISELRISASGRITNDRDTASAFAPMSTERVDNHPASDDDGWMNETERTLGSMFRSPDLDSNGAAVWYKQVFSPNYAETQLASINLRALPCEDEASDQSNSKEKSQVGLWRKMATDSAAGCRRLIGGSLLNVQAISKIANNAPNFSKLCDIFTQALGASRLTQTPLDVPPILLLGPPGIGKTFASSAIAKALGTEIVSVSMTTTTSVNPLGGTDMVWRSPKMGLVAQALIGGKTASPVFLLDEIDKSFRLAGEADPLAPLHAFLEGETARTFRDEFIEAPFATDAILWLMTANSLEGVAPSLIDRMLVLEIAPPTADQTRIVMASIYAEIIAGYGNWFAPDLSSIIADQLRSVHPRRFKRLLGLACTRAASMGRRELLADDIKAVQGLFHQNGQRQSMGFLA